MLIQLNDGPDAVLVNSEQISSVVRAKNGKTVVQMIGDTYGKWVDETPAQVYNIIAAVLAAKEANENE